jgi:hypothetical protein
VTPTAYAARLRANLVYTNVWTPGLDILPSIIYGWDIRGWSYDSAFNEGRQFTSFLLRGEYKKTWFAELSYSPTWGGAYNSARDRSFASVVVGAKF